MAWQNKTNWRFYLSLAPKNSSVWTGNELFAAINIKITGVANSEIKRKTFVCSS